MRRNYNIIKITGIKGICIAIAVVCCLIAGFLTFPGWVCMNVWNFFADMFTSVPQMTLTHGIMLWAIIALSVYALNSGDFSISFGKPSPMPTNDARIKEMLKQLHEKNVSIVPIEQVLADLEAQKESLNESEEKIEK